MAKIIVSRALAMTDWTSINTDKIKRIAYIETENSMYIDFTDSEIHTVFCNVPKALYTIFIEAKSPDKFYTQFVEGYFDVLSPGIISRSKNYHREKASK